jgi:hypothetical protein
MKTTELRIGNLVNYDTAEGDVLPNVIDWQDLKWLSEDEQGFNLVHNHIPLTEEWLLKLGFDKLGEFGEYYRIFNKGLIIDIEDVGNEFIVWVRIGDAILEPLFEVGYPIAYIQHVHQLQNLYFALTNEELTLTK